MRNPSPINHPQHGYDLRVIEHLREYLSPFEESGTLLSRAAAGKRAGNFLSGRVVALVDEAIQFCHLVGGQDVLDDEVSVQIEQILLNVWAGHCGGSCESVVWAGTR